MMLMYDGGSHDQILRSFLVILTSEQIQLLRDSVPTIMRQAGRVVLSYRFKPLKHIAKKEAGFVTEADIASEKFLIEALSRLVSNIGFVAEEHMHADRMESGQRGPTDHRFVIDPLDGTTNFTYGLPHFCISVALVDQNKPIMAWVYQPLLDELFVAELGKGTFLNGQKVSVSATKTIEESFMVFCIPYKKNPESRRFFERTITDLSQTASSLRLFGAAALDLAYVACGRYDGLVLEQLYWWDIAAGCLLVTEAGGIATEFDGSLITPTYNTMVVANPMLHNRLIASRLLT